MEAQERPDDAEVREYGKDLLKHGVLFILIFGGGLAVALLFGLGKESGPEETTATTITVKPVKTEEDRRTQINEALRHVQIRHWEEAKRLVEEYRASLEEHTEKHKILQKEVDERMRLMEEEDKRDEARFQELIKRLRGLGKEEGEP